MSALAKLRSAQAQWGGRSFTLLAIAWLNVVLQPCAVAMAASAACPDCPTTHVDEQMSHAVVAEHDDAMVMSDDDRDHGGAHEHETASGSIGCSGELVDCANLGAVNHDDRQKQLAPDGVRMWLAPPPVDCARTDDRTPPPPFRPGDAARLTGAFPPLNVLYCVYLD